MHRFKTKALVDMCVYICVCRHARVTFMRVCRHARVMSKQVCVCKSIWGVIASSLLVWENHTSSSLPNPCQGQDPLTALHCYFSVFVKCGVSMHMHTHARTQMLSAVPIFSDTSHSQVRQSLSTWCRQPPWNPHTLFHGPISIPTTSN